MAAVTGVITAVAGLGLSAYQMYEQSESKKDAEKAAANAKATMQQLEEQNVMEAIQAPDISSIAFERQAQADIQALDKIQAAGAEAVIGGVTAQTEASRQAALETSEKQAAINFQVDLERKRNEQAIASRKYEKELGMAAGELEGAQLAAKDAEMKQQAATMDMVAGIGNVVGAVGDATSLESKANRSGEGFDDGASTSQQQKNQELLQGQTSNMSNAISSSGMNSIYGSGQNWDEEAIRRNVLDEDLLSAYVKTAQNK